MPTTGREVEEKYVQAVEAFKEHGTKRAAARALNINESTLRGRIAKAVEAGLVDEDQLHEIVTDPACLAEVEGKGDDCVLTRRSRTIRTLDAALAEGNVDLDVWEVERWVLNKWDVAAKVAKVVGGAKSEQLEATELWQVKVWFKRRTPAEKALSRLLVDLKENAPVLLPIERKPYHESQRRALEVCLMDPHLGLHCFPKSSDHAWSLEDCEDICMWALTSLLELAEARGPYEEIVFPFGNDFLHADGVFHTTTAGTPQPEMLSWQDVYDRGIKLGITMVEELRKVAPVKVYAIPGNHDRQSAYTLGQVLWAYYHNTPDVQVDCCPSPYKFWNYGCNLVGFEHGHSVKPIRMAALMANECPEMWLRTRGGYREWHVGDQHRKGSGKPSMFEEQGVSVEYIPGLTPPNEWHRLKSYNWQKRGAMAFVWDYDLGPMDRLQVNINSWNGQPRGIEAPSWREQQITWG